MCSLFLKWESCAGIFQVTESGKKLLFFSSHKKCFYNSKKWSQAKKFRLHKNLVSGEECFFPIKSV